MVDAYHPDTLEIERVQEGLQLEGDDGLEKFLGFEDNLMIGGAETVSKNRNNNEILITSQTDEGFSCSIVKGNDKVGSNIVCTADRGEQ